MISETTNSTDRHDNAAGHSLRHPGSDGMFFTTVNQATVKFRDPTPNGACILEEANFKPAGDHVLVQLLGHSARSIALDEPVDLRSPGTEVFRAFKSDRIFRFTLNGHGFDWGIDRIAEREIREIGHVPDHDALVLSRDGKEVDLNSEDVVDLGSQGTEHIHTQRRLITVYFENNPREIPRGLYTTEKLKGIFGVQEGYVLEVINHEGHLTPLKAGEELKVKEGMKFFEQVPCGGSS